MSRQTFPTKYKQYFRNVLREAMLSQTYPCLEVETVSTFIPLCYNILLLLGRGCYRGGEERGYKSFGERCRRMGGNKNRRFKDFIFGEQRFAKYGF